MLTVVAMSISLFVMLGVEHVRQQAKLSFASSVSGVDLIVGARTSQLNLLLYSVFRIGSPTNNISWQSYKKLQQNKAVRWSVPISLGDSHKGFRVLGTTPDYFDFFSYGKKQTLTFEQGKPFSGVFEVVLGAQVANKWDYKLGEHLTLSHGMANTSFKRHDNLPFKVVGILAATGSPVDQTLHVSLQGLEAVHLPPNVAEKLIKISEKDGVDLQNHNVLTAKSVTAVMVRLKSKMAVFTVQRKINTDHQEPLTAIMPGIVLVELWETMSLFDNTLRLISLLVFITSLIALCAMLISSIRERTHEIKLLRMIGASPFFIFGLIECEAMVMALVSIILALGLLSVTLLLTHQVVLNGLGIAIDTNIFSSISLLMFFGVFLFLFVFIAAIPPAIMAYKGAKNSDI